ncbi:hypothetical protein Tco_0133235 [Tanacetum coccineum]
MSTSTHPIIILSDSDVKNAFSSTNTSDYTPASPDYSPASPGNTSPDSSEDPFEDHSASLTISPFHDDPYMKVMQAYNANNNESPIPPPQALNATPTILPPSLTSGAYDHEAGSSRAKRSRNFETVEEALLPDLLHKIGYGEEIDNLLKISLKEAESSEEIFFLVAWVRAFNICEPIYLELHHEFYATYEFDEVCTDDELHLKKIIGFRLGGRAHSLTLLEFSRRLGLYHADESEEEGFDTYFQGGLRSDENFNAREYWEMISTDRDLHLSRSSITSVRFLILRVLHKMITYGLCQRTIGYEKIQRNDLWLLSMFEARHQNGYANVAWVISKWIKRKGAGSQKDSQICCGQFISKIARKSRVLTEEIVHTLSTPVYRKELDRTTLRELIDSEDRLIPDIPVDEVLRVATQRAPSVQRASMQDLYERMGVYNVPLQGDYNPPGYAQPQYDQNYQQYYPQQQHDDE